MPGNSDYRRRDNNNGKPADHVFPTADEAVAELERRHGLRSATWTYNDALGEPVGVIVRWDLVEGDKEFRPVSRRADGWCIGGMPDPHPLYHLPDLADAGRVYVCEGEKAADAARSIGLTSTTSPHGSNSASKADWGPLAGKEVILVPDNDPPGVKYADDVTDILGKLKPRPVIRLIELPDVPSGGDIVDWIDAHGEAAEPDELRRQIEELVDAAEPLQVHQANAPLEHFRPFPVDVLPELIRRFVKAAAKAIGCDVTFLVLPLLTAMASAIGNTRRIEIKRGWTEPAIVWTATVGDSGTLKSPAQEVVLRPVYERQRRALIEHKNRKEEYDRKEQHYERELAKWRKSTSDENEAPSKPAEPIPEELWTDNATTEAMAVLLRDNFRGILLAKDELAGWLGDLDRYSQGKGGDAPRWLKWHGGRPDKYNRKTGEKIIYIPRAAVSVTGNIPLETLRRFLVREFYENGLVPRLLLAAPPRRRKRWTEADIAPEAEAQLAKVFDNLYSLQPAAGDDGEPCPFLIGMVPGAKAVWVEFFTSHAEEHAKLTGDHAAAWSKLEGYAARFALVLHLARWASGDPTLKSPDAVDVSSMTAGIQLAEWFKAETRRVYAMLSESDDDCERRRLVEWIHARGGSVTARQVQQGHRRYRKASEAEAALNDLVERGYGCWESTPPGQRGQPTRRFVLSTVSTVYGNTPTLEENGNTVDVDGVDDRDDELDDEWGVI